MRFKKGDIVDYKTGAKFLLPPRVIKLCDRWKGYRYQYAIGDEGTNPMSHREARQFKVIQWDKR